MKKITILLVTVVVGILVLGQSNQKQTKDITAYVIKVVRDVDMRTPTSGWQKAVPLSQLKSGYEIKTEKGSLAIILFADQSKVIVREKSIVTIRGEMQGKQIVNRNVHTDRGTVVFNVKKAETEQFRFSSPISVASIRGTQGAFNVGGGSDNLIISEGLAEFTNLISGRTMNVATGQKGVADSSGAIDVANASEDELNDIQQGQDIQDQQDEQPGAIERKYAEFSKLKSGRDGFVRLNLKQIQQKVTSVNMYYKKKGESSYREQELKINGPFASGKIEGTFIKYPALEYYFNIVLANGSSIQLPENGESNPAVEKVEPVQHILRIPGQTGALQKKVLEYKWME